MRTRLGQTLLTAGFLGLAGLVSGCSSFFAGLAAPPAPVLTSPGDGAALDTAYPELTWEAADRAIGYVITLRPSRPAGGAVRTLSALSPRYLLTAPLVVGEEYTWTVAGRNSSGVGPASAPRRLRIASNTLPVAPLLLFPEPGEPVRVAGVNFQWTPRDSLYPGWWQLQLLAQDGAVASETITSTQLQALVFDDGLDSRIPGNEGTLRVIAVDCASRYSWHVRAVWGSRLVPAASSEADVVRALSAGGAGLARAVSPWSETATFTLGDAPIQAPHTLGPPPGAHISGGRLTWSNVDLANLYEYEITTAPGLAYYLEWNHRGELRSFELRHPGALAFERSYPPLNPGVTYYWRVRGAAGSGLCAGPWSDYSSFVWDGPHQGDLGSLGAPTCVEIPGVPCEPPTPVPPTTTRTPRASRTPTPTRTATSTIAVLPSSTPTSPPAATKTAIPPTDPPKPVDKDGDGYSPDIAPKDCNDDDASINPGAPEIKDDKIDSNCNGDDNT